MTAAKMVSAMRVPNTIMTFVISAVGPLGVSRILGSIDHATYSFSSKVRSAWRTIVRWEASYAAMWDIGGVLLSGILTMRSRS